MWKWIVCSYIIYAYQQEVKYRHKFHIPLLYFLPPSVVLIMSSSIFLYDNNIILWHCLLHKFTLLSRLHAINMLPSLPLEHLEYAGYCLIHKSRTYKATHIIGTEVSIMGLICQGKVGSFHSFHLYKQMIP